MESSKYFGQKHSKFPISCSKFTFYVDVFIPLSLPRLLPYLTVYMSSTASVLQEAGIDFPSRAPKSIPVFWVGSMLLIFLVFLICVPCCDVLDVFIIKMMFGSSLLPVVCRGVKSYLCYVCLFAHTGVQHILCCVFLRVVCPALPISLDCQFLYSLTFIYLTLIANYSR